MRTRGRPSARRRAADGCFKPAYFMIAAAALLVLVACGSEPAPVSDSAALEVYPKLSQTTFRLRSPSAEAAFDRFFRAAAAGPVIPGLAEGAVPQGLGFLSARRLVLISAYFDGPTPSVILAVDATSGRLEKTIWLADAGGRPMHGHVGGLAVGPRCLWVASDEGVYRYSLSHYLSATDDSVLTADSFHRTTLVASSATYADGMLWIGEFAYYGPGARQYRTAANHHLSTPDGARHHALAGGYRVDPATGAVRGVDPSVLLSIPDRVQGLSFTHSRIFVSISYGRVNDSTLAVYRNPVASHPPSELALSGKAALPLWFLERSDRIYDVTAPPMMEGVTLIDGELLVLFESGAKKYRSTGTWPLQRLYRVGLQ